MMKTLNLFIIRIARQNLYTSIIIFVVKVPDLARLTLLDGACAWIAAVLRLNSTSSGTGTTFNLTAFPKDNG